MINDFSFLSSFIPEDVLIYYDCPRLFTTRSSKNQLFLVSWLHEMEKGDYYIITSISTKTLQLLRDNQLPLLDALNSGDVWLLKLPDDRKQIQIEQLTLSEIDNLFPECLPEPGVCLYPK